MKIGVFGCDKARTMFSHTYKLILNELAALVTLEDTKLQNSKWIFILHFD